MSFSPFNPFQIDIPGRKLKREVSDAPDPRTSCLIYCQNPKNSSKFLVRSSKYSPHHAGIDHNFELEL
jgi:hypothetical protein